MNRPIGRVLSRWLLVSLFVAASGAQDLGTPARVPALRTPASPAREAVRREARRGFPSARSTMTPMAAYQLAALTTNESEQLRTTLPNGATRGGIHRRVPATAGQMGRWETAAGGHRVWRMGIESPGAAGIRVHFRNFAVGTGKVWVHAADASASNDQDAVGPYSGRGVYDDGDFWSGAVRSDAVVVEYEAADGDTGAGDPPFTVSEVSHLAVSAFPGSVEGDKGSATAAAASCNLDVSCYSDWADTSKAVAHIVFETPQGSYVCSGTLLNTRNSSHIPYFLTANHCISDETTARSVEAYWFYKTSKCNGTAPSRSDATRVLGAQLMATDGRYGGDWTLLKLSDVPGGVFFSGWDAADLADGAQVTGVHHPAGDYMRISFGSRVTTTYTPTDKFYRILWSQGLTEGGSSGSGLFSAPLTLRGVLSNGPKYDSAAEYCAAMPFADNFGRFSAVYSGIRDYLEERTTGTAPPPSNGGPVLVSGTPRSVTLGPVTSGTLYTGSNGFRIDVPQGATRLEIKLSTSPSSADLDLFARFGTDVDLSGGNVVADYQSTGDTGEETIVITPSSSPALRAGTYYIGLALFTRNVTVTATVTATVTTGSSTQPPTGGGALTSGTPRSVSMGPVTAGTLFNGSYGMRIDVPQGATRLEIKMSTSPSSADVDLFARFGSDVDLSGGNVVADFTSAGSTGEESIVITPSSTPALRAGTYYIAFGLFTRNVTVTSTVTATVTTGTSTTPPPPSTGALTSGTPRSVSMGPVSSATLFNGSYSMRIDVPQGATKLEIKMSTTPGSADVDLFARFGADVDLSGSNVVADFQSTGDTGEESIVITPTSSPALRAGTYYIAFGLFTRNVTVTSTVTATVTTGGGGSTPPPPSGNTLTSGTPRSVSMGPVTSATLFNGSYSMKIDVPQGATRLEIKMSTSPGSADVDLFARFGSDVDLSGGNVVADWTSTGDTGEESIVITPSSSPALRAGTYYIAFGLFTRNVTVTSTVTATVTTGGGGSTTPPPSGNTLTSGTPRQTTMGPVTSGTLFNGSYGFRIDVPQGATRLEIKVSTTPGTADVDLFARYGTDVAIADGSAVADFQSTGATGEESIVITPSSSPALRAGTYYIALALFSRNVTVTSTVTATVTTESAPTPQTGGGVLTSGTPRSLSMGPVSGGTLYSGANGFRIDVPQGATRLEIKMSTSPSTADVDLFARFGSDVDVANGAVVADYQSTSDTGEESIVITPSSSPALRAGTYYIGLALFTRNVTVTSTVTATVTVPGTTTTPPPTGQTTLTSDVPTRFSLPAVTGPTLYTGRSFKIDVPEGSNRLIVKLTTTTPNADVDLYVRYGAEATVRNGSVVADFESSGPTGIETIEITSSSVPPLRAGTYVITMALYSTGITAEGTITATVERANVAPGPTSAARLVSGVAVPFALPPNDQPTLYTGSYAYRIDVPQNAEALEVVVQSANASDVDVYIRYGNPPEVVNGRVIADYNSLGQTGNERILIPSPGKPALQAGTYYIALAQYSVNTEARGWLTATVQGPKSGAPYLTKSRRADEVGPVMATIAAKDQVVKSAPALHGLVKSRAPHLKFIKKTKPRAVLQEQ